MNLVLLVSALLASALGFSLKGCSPGNRPGKALIEADRPAAAQGLPAGTVPVSGRLTYEDVSAPILADGTVGSPVTRTLPVRFARVAAVDANVDTPLLLDVPPSFTDADGNFSFPAPTGTPMRLAAFASTVGSGHGAAEVRTHGGALYVFVFSDPAGNAVTIPAGTTSVSVTAQPLPADDTQRSGGIANILDNGVTGLDYVKLITGADPGTVAYLYDANDTSGSFFDQTGSPSGGPAISIAGSTSVDDNSDEFDDLVILHELGHAIAFLLSKDSSLGGRHILSDAANPALAWSEGFATFFAALVLGTPALVDSSAILGRAPLAFVIDLETRARGSLGNFGARGIRSELTVAEVLWDLVDGAESRPNTDADQSVLTAAQLLAAVTALRGTNLYVSLNDAFNNLVIAGAISAANLNALLDAPEDQNADFPPAPGDVFPVRVVQTAVALADVVETRGVNDLLDTSTQDAANRFYVLDLAAEGSLTVTLNLGLADGLDASGTNVDVALLTDTNLAAVDTAGNAVAPINRSVQANPERIPTTGASPRLRAGRYILHVHGRNDFPGGPANATSQVVPYTLTVGP